MLLRHCPARRKRRTNRHAFPTTTAPHLDSTQGHRLRVASKGRMYDCNLFLRNQNGNETLGKEGGSNSALPISLKVSNCNGTLDCIVHSMPEVGVRHESGPIRVLARIFAGGGTRWYVLGMVVNGEIGAVQMSVRVRGLSPPVTRRLRISEQATLAQLHAALQVAFGWSDTHLYTFQIRGTQFGDPSGGIELALAGGVDITLAAFSFEIDEPFRYQYNLFVPWELDCRIESRGLISAVTPVGPAWAPRVIRLMRTSRVLQPILSGGPRAVPAWHCARWKICLRRTDWIRRNFAKRRVAFCLRHASKSQHAAPSTNDYGNCPITHGTLEICRKVKVQLVIEDESGGITTTDLVDIERGANGLVGMSLAEAKAMNGSLQRALIEAQAREAIARGAVCTACREGLRRNGTHKIRYRTAFGRIELTSPRFYTCRCQGTKRSSRSPLSAWLGSQVSPELEYLEGQFAALLPYGVSARILKTVLPLEKATSITSWKRHIHRIGDHLDREAHESLPFEPQVNEFGLPKRHPLQAIGIDGAYVKATDAPSRQEGWFEVIVGKSPPRQHTGNVFAFVHRLEQKPTERMAHFLIEQGVDPVQPTTFLSDGGETLQVPDELTGSSSPRN